MGRDYDMKPLRLPGMYPEIIDGFILAWLRHFHDKNNAMATASQWALYEFIKDLEIKLGLEEKEAHEEIKS